MDGVGVGVCSDASGKSGGVVLIPDGAFLRKYLSLLEEVLGGDQVRPSMSMSMLMSMLILESAAEAMDHRHASEAAAVNERRRIVKLCSQHSAVIPVPDLSIQIGFDGDRDKEGYGDEDEDEFDVFDYRGMSIADRSRCAVSRAANLVARSTSTSATTIIILSTDPLLQPTNHQEQATIRVMDCTAFAAFLSTTAYSSLSTYSSSSSSNNHAIASSNAKAKAEAEREFLSEHWKRLQHKCEQEYNQRNAHAPTLIHNIHSDDQSSNPAATTIPTDPFGHFEYLSHNQLQQGLAQQTFQKGKLKITSANPKEAYVTVTGIAKTITTTSTTTTTGTKMEYYLNEMHGLFNRAIDGDEVIIQPLPKELWEQPVGRRRLVHVSSTPEDEDQDDHPQSSLSSSSSSTILTNTTSATPSLSSSSESTSMSAAVVPTARVIGFAPTNKPRRKYVATMMTRSTNSTTSTSMSTDNHILVIPMDAKVPPVRIKTRISHTNLVQKRLLIEIDGWNIGSRYPHGHFVQILGTVGDMDTEMDCLLRENLVDLTPFSARALACLPNVGDGNEWTIHDEEVQKRRDLRMDCRIFSVDPVGCQDIDDAMHAKGTLLCRCDPKETVGE